MRKNILPSWLPNIASYSEIFTDLQLILGQDKFDKWPNCEQLMSYLEDDLCSLSGKKITMVAQNEALPYPKMSYEERIHKKGIVSTREENWHDFFNAMIWALFPQTKKLLNGLHIQELKNQANSLRTKSRDAITHLDESGIVVVSSSANLLDGLKQHEWLDVFYQQREYWLTINPNQKISAFIFGHGIYEKALNPFIGFTGKMYPIKVADDFFSLNKKQQYKQLDQYLAKDIEKTKGLNDNQKLSPLPVLGVPGWSEENKSREFYLNTNYFRGK